MFDILSPGLPPALAVHYGLIENGFQRLTRLVANMTPAELEYLGPAGNRNSTATLLAHLALTDLDYLHCLKGEPVPADLAARFGPYHTEEGLLPPVTGRTVDDLLAQYAEVIDLGRDYLRGLADSDAGRTVTVEWWSQPATLRYVLWHMAGHSMFHQGQIQRLRLGYKERGSGSGQAGEG